MHSFHAFIDESGDDGFVFRDPPDRASSEWFLVGALLVRDVNKANASRLLGELFNPMEAARKTPVHFAQLAHDQQVALCHGLARLPIRSIVVAVNKRMLGAGHTLEGRRRLYFYCVRFLIERISWIARDERVTGQGDGRCRLNFSHCKGLSYESLQEYMGVLRGQTTSIAWQAVDGDRFNVDAHNQSIWLRAADVMTSGFAKGLELSRHGLCEDRFARLMRPIVYQRGDRRIGYGVKVFPTVPAVEEERDNRYQWLSLYDQTVG